MSYQVLARRWRPLVFDAVVGQEPIVRTLQNALQRERIAHAYLFAGPRGVGKTTSARLLAMGLNCEADRAAGPVPCARCEPCREVVAGRALDVIEIDGASNRGIDEVRALRDNTRYAPARGRRKVYIVDEVHMLTEPAFNALLKTLEEPPAHVVFVLATTEPRRLPATILSRCQRFDFRPISAAEIAAGLARILDEERAGGSTAVAVDAEALRRIARAAEGSFRDALSLLDTALAYGEGRVTAAIVEELIGSGGAEAAWGLAEALVARQAGAALERIERAAAAGLDLALLGQEAMEVARRALLTRILGQPPGDLVPEEAERLGALGGGAEDFLLLVKGLLDVQAEMRRSPHPRIDLEVAAVRLCHRPEVQAIETLLARLEQAEAQLAGYGPGAAGPGGPVQPDLLGGPAAAPRPAPARPVARPTPPAVSGGGAAARPGPLPAAGPVAPSGLDDAWRRVVAEVTRLRPTLGHLLADAVVVEEDGRLVITVPGGNAFTQDQLRDRSSRQLVLDAVQRVLPAVRDVALGADLGAGPRPAERARAEAAGHPAVQAAVELFDGEISAVRPAAPGMSPGRHQPGAPAPDSGETR